MSPTSIYKILFFGLAAFAFSSAESLATQDLKEAFQTQRCAHQTCEHQPTGPSADLKQAKFDPKNPQALDLCVQHCSFHALSCPEQCQNGIYEISNKSFAN